MGSVQGGVLDIVSDEVRLSRVPPVEGSGLVQDSSGRTRHFGGIGVVGKTGDGRCLRTLT